jgi:hypothetical protein
MSGDIKVTGETSLSNSFLGDTVQICVVTRDLYRTLAGFVKLGIGPWRVYTFGPGTVTEQTYRGKAQSYSMRIAVGYTGATFWEIIEPLEGDSIYKEFLAAHGEGIQHVAQGCGTMSLAEQIATFEARGCKVIQSGFWNNQVRYAYMGTDDLLSTTIELFGFPENFTFPEPEEWYPAPPPKG